MALTLSSPDGTDFEVWAPERQSVKLRIGGRDLPMQRGEGGLWRVCVPGAEAGDDYSFVLDGQSRPDPCSRFQPHGVHGASRVIDPASYRWRDSGWGGISKEDLVIYEIHVGTFSKAGTYAGALGRLDHILALGATAVELMPLAQTPGRWNWGYDGVDLFAPNHQYGTPDDLRHFVEVCHERGLAVILDVVYNHLGPEGNYLAEFAGYFSRRHHTPWGPAFDFDGPGSGPVRRFIVENALYWLREFHFDGLRLDAIRLMRDDSVPPITQEIAESIHSWASGRAYPVHLIAESNVHDATLLDRSLGGGAYDLLWNDEIPHAVFSATLGQHKIDSRTYRGFADVSQALDAGFVFERNYLGGDEIIRNPMSARVDLTAMMQGLQTHDQVGNHPEGSRLHQVASSELQRAAAALVLLHPAVPMCFMGEEFGAPSPFCFFVDFGDDHLRQAVVEGRIRDYHQHDWGQFISPLEESTFLRSKLADVADGDAGMLAWYRELIALRKSWKSAGILQPAHLKVRGEADSGLFVLNYRDEKEVWVNLGPQPVELPDGREAQIHSSWSRFGGAMEEGQGRKLPAFSAAVISRF